VVLFLERVSKFGFRFILGILCKVNCASEVFTASLIRAMSYDGGTSESAIFMLLYLVCTSVTVGMHPAWNVGI
jgi:hypothetical protein